MAIVWYSEAEAESTFEETLTQWATMYGYKGCYTREETYEAVRKAKFWARNSPTAVALMRFVEDAPQKIVVVGMKGGYQCFDSTAGAAKDVQVIFVDLDGKLTVNVRTPHNIHFDPNLCTANVAPLNNRVALLHEFGHARQWIERPTLFDNTKSAPRAVLPKWGGAAKGAGGGQFDARLEKKTFGAAIREKAMAKQLPKDLGGGPKPAEMFQSDDEIKEFKAPVWGPAIEMDNMARHEWPICDELGLPKRANYRDINCTSDSAPSLTSMIRRKAQEALAKERAKEEEKRRETERQKKARTTSAACTHPGYDKTFPNALMLKLHFAAAHV